MPDTGEEPDYLAKLAEHAKRYEGMSLLLFIYALPFTHDTHRNGQKHEMCCLIRPRTQLKSEISFLLPTRTLSAPAVPLGV